MATLKTVEARIMTVERFRVDFYKNGANVKSNLENVPQYPFSMAAPDSWTVAEWISKRFHKCYPGFDVKVSDSSGTLVLNGQTTLGTIRKRG